MPSINWGGDETTAPFTSELDETSGNLVLAEDNDGNTVLLEWDGTTWQYRGPIEMNGEDVSGVGTLTATDVVADSVNTGDLTTDYIGRADDTDANSTLSLVVDNIPERNVLNIELSVTRNGGSGAVLMRFNDKTGNVYNHINVITNTETTDAAGMKLYEQPASAIDYQHRNIRVGSATDLNPEGLPTYVSLGGLARINLSESMFAGGYNDANDRISHVSKIEIITMGDLDCQGRMVVSSLDYE